MTANPTTWRFLPPRQPATPPVWDREFTAPCPHGRDVTWTARESVDQHRSWAVPGCECEPSGEGPAPATHATYPDITPDQPERGADDRRWDGPESGSVAALAGSGAEYAPVEGAA